MMVQMTRIELSHLITAGMVTYPGLPAPAICDFWMRNALPDSGFRFSAAPARVVGMGSFPVRAYAVMP